MMSLPISERPRVSVLMTIYNAAPFLRESIDSLIAQSFQNWELIAIENGSTDASPEILAGYNDPRICAFVFPKNIGRTPALVYAFNQAQGEYIAILDADDASYPQRFSRQIEHLDNNPDTVLVGSFVHMIDKSGNVFSSWSPPTDSHELQELIGWRVPMGHSSAMFRHDTAMKAGGYQEEYVHSQDYALFLKLAQYGKLAVMGEYLCKIRVTGAGMSKSPKYAIDVACEGLRLLKYARVNLSLSRKTLRMNRCQVARFEFLHGRALFFRGRIFSGLVKMVWGLLSFFVLRIRIFFMGKGSD